MSTTLVTGDALSQLIKTECKIVGLEFRAGGCGQTDLKQLIIQGYNDQLRVSAYAKCISQIMHYVEDKLSDDDFGYCAAAMLVAKSNIDIKVKGI